MGEKRVKQLGLSLSTCKMRSSKRRGKAAAAAAAAINLWFSATVISPAFGLFWFLRTAFMP
jgi:hypothetical protein